VAKKDFNSTENIDRGEKKESVPEGSGKEIPVEKTEVKNANASGQGSMGRNDQEDQNETISPTANS
jgi:hypothetical protein